MTPKKHDWIFIDEENDVYVPRIETLLLELSKKDPLTHEIITLLRDEIKDSFAAERMRNCQ